MSDKEVVGKKNVVAGVILPTWPVQTAVLQIEGQKELLVLAIELMNIPTITKPSAVQPVEEPVE